MNPAVPHHERFCHESYVLEYANCVGPVDVDIPEIVVCDPFWIVPAPIVRDSVGEFQLPANVQALADDFDNKTT